MRKVVYGIIALCLVLCAATGCTKGSSTQMAAGSDESGYAAGVAEADKSSYAVGVIAEAREDAYLVHLSSYTLYYMLVDKCGTDYSKGDSVKIGYTGAVHHYDTDMNQLLDDQFPLDGSEMYIKADEYTGVYPWENDCTFIGTVAGIVNVGRPENEWGDSYDTEYEFHVAEGDDEHLNSSLLGTVDTFFGYFSEFEEFLVPDSMKDYHYYRITYDPSTMRVTEVEQIGDSQTEELCAER